jgi:hypothetical protein
MVGYVLRPCPDKGHIGSLRSGFYSGAARMVWGGSLPRRRARSLAGVAGHQMVGCHRVLHPQSADSRSGVPFDLSSKNPIILNWHAVVILLPQGAERYPVTHTHIHKRKMCVLKCVFTDDMHLKHKQ